MKPSRAEIYQIFSVVFWKIDDFINTFWHYLTFSTCYGLIGFTISIKFEILQTRFNPKKKFLHDPNLIKHRFLGPLLQTCRKNKHNLNNFVSTCTPKTILLGFSARSWWSSSSWTIFGSLSHFCFGSRPILLRWHSLAFQTSVTHDWTNSTSSSSSSRRLLLLLKGSQ